MGDIKYTIEPIEGGNYKITSTLWVDGAFVIVNHSGLIATILAAIISYDEN